MMFALSLTGKKKLKPNGDLTQTVLSLSQSAYFEPRNPKEEETPKP
jgi:hypothetical protein